MEAFIAAASPAQQLVGMLLVGAVLAPILIAVARHLPNEPIQMDEPLGVDGLPDEGPESGAADAADEALPVPSGGDGTEPAPGIRRRRGARARTGQAVDGSDDISPEEMARGHAVARLAKSISARAQSAAGGSAAVTASQQRGKDPFALSAAERQKMDGVLQKLMPMLTAEERSRELDEAIATSREDWRVRGDAVLDEGTSKSSARCVGRTLDAGFIALVLAMGAYLLHTEYGWQPWDTLRVYLPREAAVMEGRAFQQANGVTDQVLAWLGLGPANLGDAPATG